MEAVSKTKDGRLPRQMEFPFSYAEAAREQAEITSRFLRSQISFLKSQLADAEDALLDAEARAQAGQ